ncbi:MAG: hypothetical protein R3D03_04315 [Geminicoccaceae bacterium]
MTAVRMSLAAALLLATSLPGHKAHGSPLESSLFFLPEEVSAILESRRQAKEGREVPPLRPQDDAGPADRTVAEMPRYIHLSAIMLQQDGAFEVWINGRRHDRLDGNDLWSLLSVSRDHVRLLLHRGGEAGRAITLGSNQTFDLRGNRMIEGRPRSLHERLAMVPARVR